MTVNWNRLLSQGDQTEDMSQFRAVVVVQIVDDCGVWDIRLDMDSIQSKDGEVFLRRVHRLSKITIVLGCHLTRAWKS